MVFDEKLKMFTNKELLEELKNRGFDYEAAAAVGGDYMAMDAEAADPGYVREARESCGLTKELAELMGVSYLLEDDEDDEDDEDEVCEDEVDCEEDDGEDDDGEAKAEEPVSPKKMYRILFGENWNVYDAEEIVQAIIDDGIPYTKKMVLRVSGDFKHVKGVR